MESENSARYQKLMPPSVLSCPFYGVPPEWVDWFNHRRLLEPIGNIPPAEAEQRYFAMLELPKIAA
jgi:transposase InsO family protein